ncbi:MAG TPA: leucine--tRNA ligase [Flavitalea sp.]|nr:leucine--tRNA ligase [Flavitalea sp.]
MSDGSKMEYNFSLIEKKWQEDWKKNQVYKVENDFSRPKYYVLDMFPYPSGAGLHVGHPLGYIASDIYARYKRLKGFNVLHPMGYDAFGLPAEQYAIDHGIHPASSTEQNIENFRSQLDNIGFCYDWSREVRTCEPSFYKWTQWIFLQLFDSWYDHKKNKAEPIKKLQLIFQRNGNRECPCPGDGSIHFSEADWKSFDDRRQQEILMLYRLAYCGYGEVNWCEALGTVLANDEVINGVSERGGFPVVKKKLRQWYLRITEYADRLLDGLNKVDFSDAMKEMQSNWIGKSEGAEITFEVVSNDMLNSELKVYTTRPDTIFGVDFMVVAPEHELIESITTNSEKKSVETYIAYVKSRSERERMAEKKISGCFTGAYAINPFDKRKIPIWISEYVLAGYGTGAIMGVPCGDERDHKFAMHFNISITNIIGRYYTGETANPTKDAVLENSDFLNGMIMKDAIPVVNNELEKRGMGKRKVNYKMRDAAFSRQRYWGEPFPIVWKEGIAHALPVNELPVELPYLDDLKPGPGGEGPLANLDEWKRYQEGIREVNTMPGYAGSSWYFFRYMDPHNKEVFCDRNISDYWNQVDLYIGGTEHAVGHLLYSRMWTKVLFDLGFVSFDEPYKKLVNQGKIGGDSRLVYRVHGTNEFVSAGLKDIHHTDEIHVDVSIVDGIELDISEFKKLKPEYDDATFILENGKYYCGSRLEKMSKRYFNVVNPDDIVLKYGADTFRMYEMFLGPVEQDKPWDTKGIEGVHRFLKKFWRLFFDDIKGKVWTEEQPTDAEWKILHKTIKKIEEDTERFSFNTAVSAFMVCVNELHDLKCFKKPILEPLVIMLTPYAPHISEELFHILGNSTTVLNATFPDLKDQYLIESSKNYPVSVNGKVRTQLDIRLDATQEQVEKLIHSNEIIAKWLDGKSPKKIIYVRNKMINVVV